MQSLGQFKRPRALQACAVCRVRKNRCSEDRPCTYCVDHDLECTYLRTPREKKQKPQPVSQTEQRDTRTSLPHYTETFSSANVDFDTNNTVQVMNSNSSRPPVASTVDQSQHRRTTEAASVRDETSYTPSTVTPQNTAPDIMETNLHTNNLEFYGSASSVAFLRHVETLSNSQTTGLLAGPAEQSLTSLLHNTDFQPGKSHGPSNPSRDVDLNPDRFYFRVARRFLDAYFSNIHFIQPIFEEDVFLARCEDLWFNKSGNQPLSFIALYYATLSLGSLVMTFETPEISGADRFTWSRKLFNDALTLVTQLGTATSVEMVQCFYMMSKICQHELNPHVAYLYSGQAARTSLAIGINRSPISSDRVNSPASMSASKTWWAVYCLDIQTSFALGRPDSLGPDEYHTQHLPTVPSDHPPPDLHVLHIVSCMVGLSRIMRKAGLDLYTRPCEMAQMLYRARALDAELEQWLEQVPSHLRTQEPNSSGTSLKPRRVASYVKKQAVALRLRYLNLRMIIHAVFMTDLGEITADEAQSFRDCRCQCLQSAEDAIDLVYATFLADDYFQTWWYNSTYILFAVSVLLAMVFRQLARTKAALDNLFAHIDRAILILQAMDDCVVARNATCIIKRTLARAKKVSQPALAAQQFSQAEDLETSDVQEPKANFLRRAESENVDLLFPPHAVDDTALVPAVDDFDWLSSYAFEDSQQALFWTEWARELDTLGT